MTKTYYEVAIQPSPSGFGEYQCLPPNGDGWEDVDDLLTEITSQNHHVFELADDMLDVLPGQIEDIRGRIHNEPARVFGIVHPDNSVSYFGIAIA